MINLIRKLVKKLFFKGPYKARPLSYFLKKKYQHGIHEPEGQLQILKEEPGNLFWYYAPNFLYDTSVKKVEINGKSRYLDAGVFVQPKRVLYSVNYAGTLGSAGVIYLPAIRTVISETAIGYETRPEDHSVLTAVHTSPAVHLKGVSFSMVKMASEGYYHFLLEALPKLLFCKDLVDNVDNVIISGDNNKAILAWLNAAGAPIQKLRFTDGLTNYHCDQLLFTCDLVTDMQPNPWCVNLLRRTFTTLENKKPFRWIWASRSDSTSRNVEWEEELLAAFPKLERMVFSQLSPREVVETMGECAVFIGPHGAAFSNIVFQQPGTCVIEFYPQEGHFFRPVYSRLAGVSGLKHIYITHNFSTNEGVSKKVKDALNILHVE